LNKSGEEAGIKLLVDAMLGRLAKWLRILGYDTAYLADTDDFAVMRLARAEDRLILTRDRGLARRRGVRALLVSGESLEEQLRQVCGVLGLPAEGAFSRCPVCNQALMDATPEQVATGVPGYVQRTQECFSFCGGCNRIYWRGTHWQRMAAFVSRLRDEGGSDTIGMETHSPEP